MLPQLDDERKEHVRFECLKAGREFFFENDFPGHWVLDDSSDEPLTLLGGPRKLFSESDPISLIPIEPTSHYSGLSRPGRVPGPCRLFTKKKEVQNIVEMFWHGDCKFMTQEQGGYQFTLMAYIEAESECNHKVGMNIQFTGDGRWNFSAFCSPLLDCSFGVDDKNILGCRIAHLFLRQYASILNPDYSHALIQRVIMEWQGSKRFLKENLDACILRADLVYAINATLTFNVYTPMHVDKAMDIVGEALEGLGQFEKAALLYLETAESFRKDDPEVYLSHVNAAIAFRKNVDYDAALQQYAAAFRSLSKTRTQSNWNLNDADTTFVVSNLFSCLGHVQRHAIIEMQNRAGGNGALEGKWSEGSTDEPVFVIFSCLLGRAGFKPPRDGSPVAKKLACAPTLDKIAATQQGNRSTLKTTFEKTKIARKTVIQAFQSGSWERFKEIIFSTVAPQFFQGKRRYVPPVTDVIRNQEEQRKLDEKRSKKVIKNSTSQIIFKCHQCQADEGDEKFLVCACHQVQYCSPECQNADWHSHQKSCAVRVPTCDNCGARKPSGEKLMMCPCRKVSYCCKDCQVDHRRHHKNECVVKSAKKAAK